MSIYAELNVETKARNGTVVRKYLIEIAIDSGQNSGAVVYLDPPQARAFVDDLRMLLAEIPAAETHNE